jgi:hypothetical protein
MKPTAHREKEPSSLIQLPLINYKIEVGYHPKSLQEKKASPVT